MFIFQQVVLIDDSRLANMVTGKMLDIHRISENVSAFTDATEALGYLHAYFPNGKPEKRLVLLDIHMPGLDGFAFLDEFAKLSPVQQKAWSIYMLSSSISPVDIERAEAHPLVDGYIMKPLTASFFDRFKDQS
ncbi:MAG: response regulator [Bacteroidia bacterium]